MAICIVAIMNREGVRLAYHMMLYNESRPEFLADAEWKPNKAGSSRIIRSRFPPGIDETELVASLEAEKFEIDFQNRTAERVLQNLPCNEHLLVSWTSNERNKITAVAGSVDEAGCL